MQENTDQLSEKWTGLNRDEQKELIRKSAKSKYTTKKKDDKFLIQEESPGISVHIS